MIKAPELLLPAGTLKNMHYAFAFGADAVYAGQPRYSLRVRNNDFGLENLGKGIDEAHRLGKKLFVASNIMPHNAKVKTYMADMEPVIDLKPDALIMADPGLIMMVRERWPEVPIHLSVQANTVNYAAVQFWKSMGLERVILSRELSLDEIEDIRQRCPDMELEVFVHGALCIAYSGRCLLSGYFNHRDPNQGTCTNACRWEYKVHEGMESDSGDAILNTEKIDFDAMSAINNPEIFPKTEGVQRHPLADNVYLIEEQQRPGEYMPIIEDEHGTYIMNSRDLRAIQHVERLSKMGIDSLKIEGRTKSYYYVARAAQLYRQAIDDATNGKSFNPQLYGKLENLANRGYTEGFYERHPDQEYQNYLQNHSKSEQQKFVGEIIEFDAEKGLAEVVVKNKFAVGDSVEIISATGNQTIRVESMVDLKGNPLEAALGSGYQVRIPLPAAANGYDKALLAVNL
ncbi:tRNA 5-hydroxyuridine modification protein YegQ [Sulfuriflexus mobilis]|uniref:prephenate-dependent tRNA uridine(34) hydroxylase TrhP n=1 Tax=Sulfuriflexus mobilis TaxID=1811807 RepID=UPI000F824536